MKIWLRIATKIDALSRRERVLLWLTALALLFAGWNAVFLGPWQARQQAAQQALAAGRAQIAALEAEMEAVRERARQDPNQPLRIRRERLGEQLAAVDGELREASGDFVQPEDMGPLLSELLQAQRGLRLLRLESLQPVPLETEGLEGAAVLYRHGLELEFRGDYMGTLRFLEALEAMPWRLYWEHFEYQLQDYPQARVVLRIHTLSPREDWIGV